MPAKLHITEVGRVAVPAADQDRALEFYVGTLGFELLTDVTFADGKMRWIEVVPAGSSTSIALTPPMEGGPTAVDTGIVLSTTDIDADHATLKAAGVDVDAEVARWGDPVPPGLVRFSCGVEDASDLVADVLGALDRVQSAERP